MYFPETPNAGKLVRTLAALSAQRGASGDWGGLRHKDKSFLPQACHELLLDKLPLYSPAERVVTGHAVPADSIP